VSEPNSIFGAGIEPAHAVLQSVLRGEDQHRQGRLAPAQALQHLDAVQPRQAEIEDEQVELLGEQRRVGIGAVGDVIDRIARLAQRAHEPVGNDAVVFGEQDMHGKQARIVRQL
jgi:hypothetical protein